MTPVWKNIEQLSDFILTRKQNENEPYNEVWFIFKQTNKQYICTTKKIFLHIMLKMSWKNTAKLLADAVHEHKL